MTLRTLDLALWRRAEVMRATLVLSLCKLGLVTQASSLRSRLDHATVARPVHAAGRGLASGVRSAGPGHVSTSCSLI
jgi:hypothetical protein